MIATIFILNVRAVARVQQKHTYPTYKTLTRDYCYLVPNNRLIEILKRGRNLFFYAINDFCA